MKNPQHRILFYIVAILLLIGYWFTREYALFVAGAIAGGIAFILFVVSIIKR